MKKLLKKLSKKKDGQQPGPGAAAARPDYIDEDEDFTDEDDERVHDFEIGQEDYLVQVALATSAQDFQQAGSGLAALGAAATAGSFELSLKYWREHRWECRHKGLERARAQPHAACSSAWRAAATHGKQRARRCRCRRPAAGARALPRQA